MIGSYKAPKYKSQLILVPIWLSVFLANKCRCNSIVSPFPEKISSHPWAFSRLKTSKPPWKVGRYCACFHILSQFPFVKQFALHIEHIGAENVSLFLYATWWPKNFSLEW